MNTEEIKKSKSKLKSDKNMIYQKKLNWVIGKMDKESKWCIDVMRETGSSNWLSVVLVKEYNQVLNKQ